MSGEFFRQNSILKGISEIKRLEFGRMCRDFCCDCQQINSITQSGGSSMARPVGPGSGGRRLSRPIRVLPPCGDQSETGECCDRGASGALSKLTKSFSLRQTVSWVHCPKSNTIRVKSDNSENLQDHQKLNLKYQQ